jgi:hypothetical protein
LNPSLTLYIREGVGAHSSRKALFIGGREVAAKQQKIASNKNQPNPKTAALKKGRGLVLGYTGLLPVISQTTSIMMAMISKMWMRNPTAGSRIQPKSQIKMMIKAIHNRMDILRT